jgi:hypothetical protein
MIAKPFFSSFYAGLRQPLLSFYSSWAFNTALLEFLSLLYGSSCTRAVKNLSSLCETYLFYLLPLGHSTLTYTFREISSTDDEQIK